MQIRKFEGAVIESAMVKPPPLIPEQHAAFMSAQTTMSHWVDTRGQPNFGGVTLPGGTVDEEDEDDDDGEDNERPRTSASTVRRSLNGGSTIIDGIVLSYTRRRSTARISLPLGLMFRKSIGRTSIASSLSS